MIDLRKKQPGAERPAAASAPPPPHRRVSTLRARRRRLRFVYGLGILLFIAAAAYGLSYVSYLPRYTISSVTISGTNEVPPALIQAFVESVLYNGRYSYLSRQNIFLYPQLQIETAIVQYFPRISSAQITRSSTFATSIHVSVNERQAFALWCASAASSVQSATQTCYVMDNDGFIFADAPTDATTTSTGYVFSGSISTSSAQTNMIGRTFSPGHMPGILALFKLLAQAGFTPEGATVQSDQDFAVPLSQGFSIYASFGESAGTLVNNLQLILSSAPLQENQSDLEYIDLRFGDRVYYKLKGQSQETATSTQ